MVYVFDDDVLVGGGGSVVCVWILFSSSKVVVVDWKCIVSEWGYYLRFDCRKVRVWGSNKDIRFIVLVLFS